MLDGILPRGADLLRADALPVGSYLALRCCDFTLSARIVWAREQRFGVEFQFPLPDAHVRRIMDADTDAPIARLSQWGGGRYSRNGV